jgi:uncharacterized membrane protein YdjX (TVP38/TMEM64 family)
MSDMDMVHQSEPRTGRRKWVIPLLVLVGVVATSVALFFVYGRDPELLARFKGYGYLGAFLVSLIGNASVFVFWGMVLPILAVIGTMLYPASGLLGPIGVGLVGGAGAAIGEMTGYLIGYSGRGIMEKSERYNRLVSRIGRKGPLAVFVFSLVPFAFDVVAIAAGALRVPLWQFVIACWLGRTILYVSVVTLVALGWDAILPPLP